MSGPRTWGPEHGLDRHRYLVLHFLPAPGDDLAAAVMDALRDMDDLNRLTVPGASENAVWVGNMLFVPSSHLKIDWKDIEAVLRRDVDWDDLGGEDTIWGQPVRATRGNAGTAQEHVWVEGPV